ncbi:coatomer subunit zeta NDAI_0C06150 [Naumovozyma dairenensis CBS 421]|uniref:Coatomer subunit zeta n=1 Tax=Naumovozyma dairenensis (strain ATCC 10597 / BCRC 20456 / CBS 421 / NBRC 0211 / NRRL Y-12639) TaxID=1071378 RepID=G0W913_NAUDC|nr:hypothetical protein NDAI_0C06150 [Naumovozyma dairenensis CBS 421]CCD24274.1 hypothetical protein NDAI_0C06150 [Naumovozyma dairenensis CBS 421]
MSLYTVEAVLILDSEGKRLYAKYYEPPHGSLEQQQTKTDSKAISLLHPHFKTVKKQEEFESKLHAKLGKQDDEIIIFNDHLILYQHTSDITLYVIGPINGNEIILDDTLTGIKSSIDMIMGPYGGVDKRNIQEHYDEVLLAIDESIDNGIIMENFAATIAARVSKPTDEEPVTLDLDKGLMSAWGFAKSKLQEMQQNF